MLSLDSVRRFLNTLRGRDDRTRLVNVSVRKDHLLHNLNQFSQDRQVAPVLKSNAYGHGITEVANILEGRPSIPFFIVETYFEAERLRRAGITTPIVVIGFTPPETIQASSLTNVSFAVSSLEMLRQLSNSLTADQPLHLKIDTGMNRYGVHPPQIEEVISIAKDNENINLEGVFSHLCDAYTDTGEFTDTQIRRWNNTIEQLKQSLSIKHAHLAATSGHYFRDKINAGVERIGIGLYGVTSYESDIPLKPVLSLETVVGQIKQVPAGQTIGYDRAYKAGKDMQIAVLPIGYNEGIDRRLSNSGVVRIKGEVCPIVGKVSMNATTVDITELENVSVGEKVEVISADPEAQNSALHTADTADTIPHVILTGISEYLRREVI